MKRTDTSKRIKVGSWPKLTIRLPADVHRALKARAAEEGRSCAVIVESLVRQYLHAIQDAASDGFGQMLTDFLEKENAGSKVMVFPGGALEPTAAMLAEGQSLKRVWPGLKGRRRKKA